MRIEPYDPGHLDAIVRLSLRAWAPVFESIENVMDPEVYHDLHPDWRADQQAAVEGVCADAGIHVWVALEGDSVAGFVAVKRHVSAMGEIYMIAVDPGFQGQGIGSALTGHALDWMKGAGIAVAMVETGGDPGHAPARHTYEKMGFGLLPIARYFKKL